MQNSCKKIWSWIVQRDLLFPFLTICCRTGTDLWDETSRIYFSRLLVLNLALKTYCETSFKRKGRSQMSITLDFQFFPVCWTVSTYGINHSLGFLYLQSLRDLEICRREHDRARNTKEFSIDARGQFPVFRRSGELQLAGNASNRCSSV